MIIEWNNSWWHCCSWLYSKTSTTIHMQKKLHNNTHLHNTYFIKEYNRSHVIKEILDIVKEISACSLHFVPTGTCICCTTNIKCQTTSHFRIARIEPSYWRNKWDKLQTTLWLLLSNSSNISTTNQGKLVKSAGFTFPWSNFRVSDPWDLTMFNLCASWQD